MSDRIRTCLLAIACAAVFTTSHAWAGDQNFVEANGPVSISGPLMVGLSAAPPESAHGTRAIPPTVPAEQPAKISEAEAASDVPPQPVAPASEHKQLGKPNGPLSARPAEPSASSSSGLLNRFDPRTNEITKVGGALLVVVGLILLIKATLRRASERLGGGSRPSGVLEVLARYRIGRGQQLILLKVARRIVLAHQSGAAMTTLSEISDPDEVAALLTRMEAGSDSKNAAKFRQTFENFMAEHASTTAAKGVKSLDAVPGGADVELVDLTRNRSRGLTGLLGRRSSR